MTTTKTLGTRNPPLPDPDGTIEPTQEYFLRFMREQGFTDEQIKANREYNGRLYLEPGVVIGSVRGLPEGAKVNTRTGELIEDAEQWIVETASW